MAEPSSTEARARAYWRANRILITVLLVIWAAVSFGCSIVFVEPLNAFRIGSLPLGFWFAQQGSIYVFVVLIFVYAFAMDRIDRRYGFGAYRDTGADAGAGRAGR